MALGHEGDTIYMRRQHRLDVRVAALDVEIDRGYKMMSERMIKTVARVLATTTRVLAMVAWI